jgi:tight adherence protein C
MIAVPVAAAALAFVTVLLAGRAGSRTSEASPADPRLDLAGIRGPSDQLSFRLLRMASLASAASSAGLLTSMQGAQLPGCMAAAAVGGVVGYWIPGAWLEARAARRRIEMLSELPAMLDLLQISMRGGMGLHAAWTAVSESLRGGGDALAEEMRRIDLDVSFGNGWSVALARASDRTGIGELRSLGSLLGQTERFGSDLARTLEVMADSLRHEEMQTIEERAHRASVKMLFPLAALMLPATLLLIVAPLLLLLFEALMKATA